MSDTLGDLLKQRASREPSEFAIIRDFTVAQLGMAPKLSVSQKNITITLPNSAAAGTLRLQLHELQELCGSRYRLSIRIG